MLKGPCIHWTFYADPCLRVTQVGNIEMRDRSSVQVPPCEVSYVGTSGRLISEKTYQRTKAFSGGLAPVEGGSVRSLILCSSVLLITCFCTLVQAESVQDRGLPGAVAFEAVFPHIVSGSLGDVKYQSDLIIVNSQDRKAVIELDFYFNSGQTANDLLAGPSDWVVAPWARMENLERSPGNGRFYEEVPGHSVRRLSIPGRKSSLVGEEFSAWARLRSNVDISAYQEVRVVDQRGKSYQAEMTPSTLAAGSADLRVTADRSGPSIGTYGISLVNPRSG